ncbi:SMI1/KNR4 family protein [Myxococcus sp. K15C18031901]|uniref:SMI1/KNR4 family protein n=1 Tax=Myxococcus dinghuensis TaxID=2906761 RepID=UPI0020A80026|nr:SMI1/KNR4 family protein [Myxococcus dinghuensis]MCP3102640.1 SMI1/KNR4 family protein [Myxococcus dinghuensis]
MTPLDELLDIVVREHFPHAPASEQEISDFEARAGWRLGPELHAFYRRSNGAELFVPLPDARYSILSLAELQRARVRMRGIDDDSMGPASWWTLVDCQDSDFILVNVARPAPYPMLDAFHETYPSVRQVAASFQEFLTRALASNNRLYWLADQ